MPPLLYPLPTTSLLNFSDLLHDPSSSYRNAIADATSARTRLHLTIKAVASGEPGSSALAVLDAVQGYLPYLRGIIACLAADELLFKGEPVFSWRPSLTPDSVSPPSLPLPSIHCEHLFVLLTYTLALSNHANSILASLPTFEATPGTKAYISSEDEKKTTVGLARAVELLCQASGVAEWTAENVVPLVEPLQVARGGNRGKNKWAFELGAEAIRGLSTTSLADAHVTAIRKLLLPVSSHALFSPPGPPLPRSHPSPILLAKLYLHVASLYSSARALFKAHPSEPYARKLFKTDCNKLDPVDDQITPFFKRYLRKESILASALAYKWLGVDAGDNGNGAKLGEALALLQESKRKLEELQDGVVREKMKGLGIGKVYERRNEERRARKGRVERELEDVSGWLKAYSRMNDTVSFHSVPPMSSFNIPSGRPILTAKAFAPPASKFGPLHHEERRDDSNETYAGRGTYY